MSIIFFPLTAFQPEQFLTAGAVPDSWSVPDSRSSTWQLECSWQPEQHPTASMDRTTGWSLTARTPFLATESLTAEVTWQPRVNRGGRWTAWTHNKLHTWTRACWRRRSIISIDPPSPPPPEGSKTGQVYSCAILQIWTLPKQQCHHQLFIKPSTYSHANHWINIKRGGWPPYEIFISH